MSEHARLSPSAADRWISCPASVLLTEGMPNPSSAFAEEGNRAHAYSEWLATVQLLGDLPERDVAADDEDMHRHSQAYVHYLQSRMGPESVLLLEQRLPTGIDSCWGTVDAVILSPGQLEIVDLKYGQGVKVSAIGNSQLRLYAVAALETFGEVFGEPDVIRMSIFQPRVAGEVSMEVLTPKKLRAWRDEVAQIAADALQPGAEFGPSEKACRWCPAAGVCEVRTNAILSQDFGVPGLLDPDQMADALTRLPDVKAWCTAIEQGALQMAYSDGKTIPGFKVVRSRGRRSITDETRALGILEDAGVDPIDCSETKLFGITALEKLLGKQRFADLLSPVITKSEGNPVVVSDEDSRASIDPADDAIKEFGG